MMQTPQITAALSAYNPSLPWCYSVKPHFTADMYVCMILALYNMKYGLFSLLCENTLLYIAQLQYFTAASSPYEKQQQIHLPSFTKTLDALFLYSCSL